MRRSPIANMLFRGQTRGCLKVLREINSGSEGIVYLCEDIKGKKYATKRYHKGKLAMMNRELYFHRTNMTKERFLHPIDVAHLDNEDADGYDSIVFPYVGGGDGFNFVNYFTMKDGYNKRLAQEFLLEHCMEFWKTVHICHERNICHWDIKPINILVDNYKVFSMRKPHNMFLIDFGLSVRSQYIHRHPPSRVYSAPEVLERNKTRPITQKCDVWSAGASWLTMAVGHEGLLTYSHGEKMRKMDISI